jgi:hypothetical protein
VKAVKHYTKAELKIIKDMTLSDQEVATMVNRTKQAVYCKRWMMKLNGKRKRGRKPYMESVASTPKLDESIQVKAVVDHIMRTKQFKKLVVGNITIDLENKVVTVNI